MFGRRPRQPSSRRQFLRGLGGFTLALPLLPSLLTREALAQVGPAPGEGFGPKRMVSFVTGHGAIWPQYMWPDEASASQPQFVYGSHDVHQGPLSLGSVGGSVGLSHVLSGPMMTQALADKMFLVRGCDIPFYIGHHSGGNLGNYARNDLDGEAVVPISPRVTIDQIMRHSDSFYAPGAGIIRPSIHIGELNPDRGISWGYVNPTTKTGVQGMTVEPSSLALFNDIFTGGAPSAPGTPQAPKVVDRVFAQYQQLTSGAFGPANRLSSADRDKLEGYMSHLSELESKLNATVTPSASCGDVVPPDQGTLSDVGIICDAGDAAQHYQLWNDVIVAAFMCDTSRIVTVQVNEAWDDQACNGDTWHSKIAHECGKHFDTIGLQMANAVQLFYREVYMDLVTKLEAVATGEGKSLLDDSLVWWSLESGPLTHESISMPIVAAGSARGYFQTGRYYDLRHRESNKFGLDPEWPVSGLLRPGLLWNQWLATVLHSMGVPPSEWEQSGVKGYGELHNAHGYPDGVLAAASDPFPMMTTA